MLEDYRPYVISVSVLVAPVEIGETLPHPSERGSTPMGGGAATPVWRERLTAFSAMAKSVVPSAGGPDRCRAARQKRAAQRGVRFSWLTAGRQPEPGLCTRSR
jgi:hypothetical protein